MTRTDWIAMTIGFGALVLLHLIQAARLRGICRQLKDLHEKTEKLLQYHQWRT